MKLWMLLRKRLVALLVKQGRYKAAESNIETGIDECKRASDSLSRVELLSQRAKVEVLTGRILEIHKDRRIGAVPTAERCLALANKALPIPTVQAVQSRLMLYTVLEQNPTLMTSIQFGKAPSVISDQSAQAKAEEVSSEALLDAQSQVNISPIAKDLQMREAASKKKGKVPIATMDNPGEYRDYKLALADLIDQCIHDLDCMLEAEGFDLFPYNVNKLQHIKRTDEVNE